MSTLLVSLGISPAIVPEAFLLPGGHFSEVHVLTTGSTKVDFVLEWFANHAPAVRLAITRVAGFTDFNSEQDHFRFEEVLYRWFLQHRGNEPPFVCLTGGFKTMSAAMQKAAAVLGAAEVFHVLCDLPQAEQPKTAEEIEAARKGGHLHCIKLGPESGWPQFRNDAPADYPLALEKQDGPVCWVSAPDSKFRDRFREVVERSHRIATEWGRLADLPFPVLATWPSSALAWMEQSVDSVADRDWVASLPKLELHCHLGGFATHGDLLERVRAAAADPGRLPALKSCAPPDGWPHATLGGPPQDRLRVYMALGDNNGSDLLRDPGCLRRQCELLHAHLREQNVIHAEIRCSPANYADPGRRRSPWTVLQEIKEHFDRCMKVDPGCHVNLIIIATRKEKGDYRAAISRHLALAVSAAEHWTSAGECRVVGVDLAGYEDKETRAHYFREEFTAVHRCGLALTVHAGENDDAEGIWRAVFDLNARRLGHALHLIESPELMHSVADRGIGVEMCPYANLQIKGYAMPPAVPPDDPRTYPLKRYLDAGIRVTVNTDNIGISSASLTDNLLLGARMGGSLTRMNLLQLQANAISAAFVDPTQRSLMLSRFAAQLPLPAA